MGFWALTRQNANAYLERLLKGLGYQVIIFIEATQRIGEHPHINGVLLKENRRAFMKAVLVA